jgi:hypothetical protein
MPCDWPNLRVKGSNARIKLKSHAHKASLTLERIPSPQVGTHSPLALDHTLKVVTARTVLVGL